MSSIIDTSAIDSVITDLMGKHSDKQVISLLQKARERAEKYNSLDHEFIDVLKEIAKNDGKDLYDSEQYASLVNELHENAIVIYFKSADLFRVYTPEEFETKFTYRINAEYRRSKDIYEVVNNSHPQKVIMIIKSDDMSELNKIKGYIVQYARTAGHSITENDLLIFKNTASGESEIVINKIVVPNAQARTDFIVKLTQYITNAEKSTNTANKVKLIDLSPIDAAAIYLVPELKQLLNQPIKREKDGYVNPSVSVVVNIGSINVQNIHTQVFQQGGILNINTFDTGEDVLEKLLSDLPEWFVEGSEIEYDTLYGHCAGLVDYPLSKKNFTKKYENILFVFGPRVKLSSGGKRRNAQMIKLLNPHQINCE